MLINVCLFKKKKFQSHLNLQEKRKKLWPSPSCLKEYSMRAQSRPTLCNPTDSSSPPCNSVHGISQARILGWVVISYSRGSSWPRDCIARQILYHRTTEECRHRVCSRKRVTSTGICKDYGLGFLKGILGLAEPKDHSPIVSVWPRYICLPNTCFSVFI